ncbi:MAG: hypothetical protein JNG84_09295 [Archangium sp.]|nr:hypothetical protein [Archangium sp.]
MRTPWVGLFFLTAGCQHLHLQPGEICRDTGQVDFRLNVNDLSAWEGRTAWTAALEFSPLNFSLPQRLQILRRETIRRGSFSTFCGHSVTPGLHPIWAVFIDVDGDGRCAAGDVGTEHPEYAWPHSGFERTFPDHGDGLTWRPVDELERDFCTRFFDSVRPAPESP